MAALQKNTVQHTLCMPLCGRMIAARKYPDLFPDRDAERIVWELGEDISGKALYRLQYMWMNCLIRQYNLAWEITEYLKNHPKATVVELGAGLSCLRRQMGNETNSWYCLDMADVIALRETHIPKGAQEKNIIAISMTFPGLIKSTSILQRVLYSPLEGCSIILKRTRCAVCCAPWQSGSPAV